ncbi:MAG: C45 family autoproteolytic acyltransferase/hydrolase [Planctomycetota bacterium]
MVNTERKARRLRLSVPPWSRRWWISLLVSSVELLLRVRWLVMRLLGLAAGVCGAPNAATEANAACCRLPALMRQPLSLRSQSTEAGGRATEFVARDGPGYTRRNQATLRPSEAGSRAKEGAARVDIRGRVPIVHLYGSPEEMGLQYGRLMGPALRALTSCVAAAIPDRMQNLFLAMTRRGEAHLPVDIRREIIAMADAAEAPFETLAALNVVTRIACTTIAAPDADGRLVMGRNGDFFGMGLGERGMLTVVRHPPKARATATVAFLGMVGAFTGMNDAGVAYGNMLVFNAAGPKWKPTGLPIQIALRAAAETAGTAAELIEALTAQSHAIPMNIMAADADEALVLELGLADTALRRAEANGLLVATNHFRTPELASHPERCDRYLRLTGNNDRPVVMTVADMKRALHRNRIRMMNLQAVVFEPERMQMHVAVNRLPASAGPYVALDLARLFAS